jgi:asparagine synthase (glutamine-hydrolysing)
LEVREPFLDHDLIEWVLAVSDVEKYPHFPKQLLVEAMGDLLPPEIVHRPKMGFTFPWDQWMKHELKSYCIEGLQALQRHPLINGLEIEKSWQDFLQGSTRITWSRIWPLVVLGQWMKINQIEGT